MTLHFRRKIFISYLILFFLFVAILFPFINTTVQNLLRKSLEVKAEELTFPLQEAASLDEIIQIMQEKDTFAFQRVSLFDAQGNLLFDPHPKSKLTSQEGATAILDAMAFQVGYQEAFSSVFRATFAHVAISFSSHGTTYILRLGVPFNEIRTIANNFEMGFLFLGILTLSLYSLITWAIIHHLSRPFQKIMETIRPYQEGKEEFLPRIIPHTPFPIDEFGALAHTLNSLNERIRKQIEIVIDQKKEGEDILQSLGEGVLALDAKSKVTFVNEAACKMLFSSQATLLGSSFQKISQNLDQQSASLFKKCHELILHTLQSSEIAEDHWIDPVHKTYLQLYTYPRTRHLGVTLVFQDKTSDYKMLEMGKDFIANASHELRTPLTVILGFAEMLQEAPKLPKKQVQGILETITKTCSRLDKLVKGLLTLADLENLNEKDFKPSKILPLIESSKQLMNAAYPKAKIHIESKILSPKAYIHSDLMDLAITNLLENAIKYSEEGAPIILRLKEKKEHLCIEIQDHGIGIPKDDLPHIFHRFYTVDKARSRKSGGSGLGLSIVKTIIEKKHRGTLSVHSIPGKGSLFEILLPQTT